MEDHLASLYMKGVKMQKSNNPTEKGHVISSGEEISCTFNIFLVNTVSNLNIQSNLYKTTTLGITQKQLS